MENIKVYVCNKCGKIIYSNELLKEDSIIIDCQKCPICSKIKEMDKDNESSVNVRC